MRLRIDHLKTGAGHKNRFQFCSTFPGTQILYLRAIHGHSGENIVDPSLSDNVLIPTTSLSSSITSGVASTCTLSLHQDWLREAKLMGDIVKQCSSQLLTLWTNVGLSKKNTTWHSPVTLLTNKIGNVFRMRCIGTKICRAQNMGLKFFQTRSNAIILHNTLPATCIESVVSRTTEEVFFYENEVASSCTDYYAQV